MEQGDKAKAISAYSHQFQDGELIECVQPCAISLWRSLKTDSKCGDQILVESDFEVIENNTTNSK